MWVFCPPSLYLLFIFLSFPFPKSWWRGKRKMNENKMKNKKVVNPSIHAQATKKGGWHNMKLQSQKTLEILSVFDIVLCAHVGCSLQTVGVCLSWLFLWMSCSLHFLLLTGDEENALSFVGNFTWKVSKKISKNLYWRMNF